MAHEEIPPHLQMLLEVDVVAFNAVRQEVVVEVPRLAGSEEVNDLRVRKSWIIEVIGSFVRIDAVRSLRTLTVCPNLRKAGRYE